MCGASSTMSGVHALSTDEEIFVFLGGREPGDPVPSGMITGVDPFSIEPWDSPENIFYLYNSEDLQSHGVENGGHPKSDNHNCEIRGTRAGYWKSMTNDARMSKICLTHCRKTTREFYLGQSPFGSKTTWRMHEYYAERQSHKEYNSLCIVFSQDDQKLDINEHHNPGDAVKGVGLADAERLEAVLLSHLDDQGPCCSLPDDANRIEPVDGDEQRQAGTPSSSSVIGRRHASRDAMSGWMPTEFELSTEDYLELDDICTPGSDSTSPSSWDDSEEFFDPDSLLRDLHAASGSDPGAENPDFRFNVSSSVQPWPPPSGSVHSNRDDCEVEKPSTSTRRYETFSTLESLPTLPSSWNDSEEYFDADSLLRELHTASGSDPGAENLEFNSNRDGCEVENPKASSFPYENFSAPSTAPRLSGARTPASSGTSSPGRRSRSSSGGGMGSKVGRATKLAKRYCCFAAFYPHPGS